VHVQIRNLKSIANKGNTSSFSRI